MSEQALINVLRKNPFDLLLKDSFFDPRVFSDTPVSYPTAPVNIKRDENSVTVELYIPGYKKEALKIEYKDNQLIVEGTQEEDSNDYAYQETKRQSFKRKIQLDETVNGNKSTAELNDGILSIQFKLKDTVKSKSITIQ